MGLEGLNPANSLAKNPRGNSAEGSSRHELSPPALYLGSRDSRRKVRQRAVLLINVNGGVEGMIFDGKSNFGLCFQKLPLSSRSAAW